MADALDELAEFEEFKDQVLPAIRKDLAAGLTESQILEKYKALAAAAVVTITTKIDQPAVALAAAKDILDRTRGKAKESKDVTHRFSQMPEKEIDAILASELGALELLEAGDEPEEQN